MPISSASAGIRERSPSRSAAAPRNGAQTAVSWPIKAALDLLAQRSPNNKVLIGQNGWLYLINDSNSFLQFQFGLRQWTQADCEAATGKISERARRIAALGSRYLMTIQPERSIVYKEFLPDPICHFPNHEPRPAQILSAALPDTVSYPLAMMADLKALGNIFHRGDTHINWVGSYILYRAILAQMSAAGIDTLSESLTLADLQPSLAAYGGDLYEQMDDEQHRELARIQGPYSAGFGVEDLIKYTIRPKHQNYAYIENDPAYSAYNERPLITTERPGSSLPTAVIFRGSSMTHVIPLIARHFSRCVYVWHKNIPFSEVIEKEKPDIVLHVIAERFLWVLPTTNILPTRPRH